MDTNVSHKGLYIMGRNTKRPNITKGSIKPKQKHYKNYKRVPILRSEANPRSLSKGLGHDSINCSDIVMTIPSHASIIASRLEEIRPRILAFYYLQPNTQT